MNNNYEYNEENSLHLFVRTSNYKSVKHLLKQGVNVDTLESDTCSALHYAAFNGDEKMVKILVKHGADVNQHDTSIGTMWTPLHRAIVQVVKILIKAGANVNICLQDQKTPLHTAASSGSTKCAQLLVENGAKWNAVESQGNTPKMLAEHFGHLDTVQYFSSLEASLKKGNKEELQE